MLLFLHLKDSNAIGNIQKVLKLKLIQIKKQAAKLNEKSTDKQILAILDLLQLSLIDLHLEIEEKFFNRSPI